MFLNSETCDGLPIDSVNLNTTVRFPVDYGTIVEVFCDPSSNTDLSGDKVLTCDSGKDYTFSEKPKCYDIGKCCTVASIILQ